MSRKRSRSDSYPSDRNGDGQAIGRNGESQAKKPMDEQKMDRNDDEIRQTGVTAAAFQSLRAVIDEVETVCGAISNQSVQAKLLDACYSSVDDLRKESRRAIDNQRRHLQEQMLRFEEIVATQSQENQENRDPRHEHRDVIAAHVKIEEEEDKDDVIKRLGKELLQQVPTFQNTTNRWKEKMEQLIKLKLKEPKIVVKEDLFSRAAKEYQLPASAFRQAFFKLMNHHPELKKPADHFFYYVI